MRKSLLTTMTFLAILTVSFLACKKTGDVDEKVETYHPIDFKAMKIGELHNQYIIAAYSKLKSVRSRASQRTQTLDQYREQIINEFENISYDPTPLGITHEAFINRAVNLTDSLSIYQYDVRNWDYTYVTQNASTYVGRILSEGENAQTLSDINQVLNTIASDANANLSGVDLDIVKGTIEIARSSAYLWAPESQGGYDLYTKTFGTSGTGGRSSVSSRVQLSWWKRAFIGDVSASSQYFLGMGVGLAVGLATPGTNAAILGGWAISAGIGSAFAALGA